ncbi:DNA polymerase subunit beta [Ktedonobacteria bacterium brp13]|nr:DNA polymerase subunit beta [Ktedonobacteria bacterium brp13]
MNRLKLMQEDILGMLLTGSVARGDALPGSDLDVHYLLPPGKSRPFQSELHHGIVVERSYADLARAQSKLETNPMEVYAYLDGRILFDPLGTLMQLREQARKYFETYQFSEKERLGIAYWLKSARLKMTVALTADDLLKAAFVASTNSKDLSKGPDEIERQLYYLFCGETQQRVQTAIDLIDWVLEHLKSRNET